MKIERVYAPKDKEDVVFIMNWNFLSGLQYEQLSMKSHGRKTEKDFLYDFGGATVAIIRPKKQLSEHLLNVAV